MPPTDFVSGGLLFFLLFLFLKPDEPFDILADLKHSLSEFIEIFAKISTSRSMFRIKSYSISALARKRRSE